MKYRLITQSLFHAEGHIMEMLKGLGFTFRRKPSAKYKTCGIKWYGLISDSEITINSISDLMALVELAGPVTVCEDRIILSH